MPCVRGGRDRSVNDSDHGELRFPRRTYLDRLVVDRVHAFEPEADVDEDEDRPLPRLPIDETRLDDLALVDRPVDTADDTDSSWLVRVDERLDRPGSRRGPEPLANLLAEEFPLTRESVYGERRQGRRVVEKEREDASIGGCMGGA